MSSSEGFPYLHPFGNGVLSSRSAFSSERTLLAIISGIHEGIVQGILWESLPLTRVFIKERLALSAFLTCYCSPQADGPLWRLNSGAGLNIPVEGQSFITGNNSIFGCNCSGWKEGAVGTLSCRSKKESDSLLQEFSTLNFVLGGFSCGELDLEPKGAVRDLHSNFSRLALASPNSGQGRMDQANENVGLADLKEKFQAFV